MRQLNHLIGALARRTAILAVFAAFAITGPATAQFGEAAGFAEAMTPEWYKRDLVLFKEALRLDDAQTVIVETMFWDYQDAFEEGKKAMLQSFTDMKDDLNVDDPNRIMQIIFSPLEDWIIERKRIGIDFQDNVQVILTPEQRERWPGLIRQDRREKRLPGGKLSGERLNLFHIVRDAGYEPVVAENLQPMLDEYALQLDQAIVLRDNLLSNSQSDIIRSLQTDDADLGLAVIDRQVDARCRVRDVNDQYAEQVSGMLPEDLGTAFLLSVRERAYPRVFRSTPVARLFKAALKIEGLSPETIAAIQELEQSYLRELAQLNEQILVLVRNHEPKELRQRAAAFTRRMGRTLDRLNDPTREAFSNRQKLGRRYAEQLRALLTLDQFKSLPGAARYLRPEEGAKPNHSLGGAGNKKRTRTPSQSGAGAGKGKGKGKGK